MGTQNVLSTSMEPAQCLDTLGVSKFPRVNDHVVIMPADKTHQKQLFKLVYKNVFEQPSCIGKISGYFTKRNYASALVSFLLAVKLIFPNISLPVLALFAPVFALCHASIMKFVYLNFILSDLHDIESSYLTPERKSIWVAVDHESNEIVGSIAVTFDPRKPGQAQLKRMFVSPDYRGQRIAKCLLQVALCFCESNGFQSLFLITTSDHQAAINLYLKTGFSPIKEWPLWSLRGWFKVSDIYLIKLLTSHSK